jgi:glycosyltransferase involved in cell wall biosynthesis
VKVLYLDHTSLVSGAQRALLDLLSCLPEDVEPVLLCPEGPLADAARALGIEVLEFAGTAGSLRLHPRNTLKATTEILRSGRALTRVVRETGASVIHANSLRAGLIAASARGARKVPRVVHVHDALPASRSAAVVRRVLQSRLTAAITISEYTTANYAPSGSKQPIYMLSNPIDVDRFDPGVMSRDEARTRLGLPRDSELLGHVAQITPWKGQDIAIKALKELHETHPNARLLIVGEAKFVDRATRYDNVAYLESLHSLVNELDLERHVEFWGERDDVSVVMRALDVLVAPSWEEPFGRSIIEAMAVETPVVATNLGGPAEFIQDGIDGIVLPPRDLERWGDALRRLFDDAAARQALAERGSSKVRARYDRRNYAIRVINAYEDMQGIPRRSDVTDGAARETTLARRVLFVDHQSVIGGGQRSLLELMSRLRDDYEVVLACPPGLLAEAARERGARVVAIPESQLTFRIHPTHTSRELVRAVTARWAVRKCVERERPDVIHANSVRAGLLLPGSTNSVPKIIHCRDLLPDSPAGRAVRRALFSRDATIIAVSEAVASGLCGPDWRARGITVVDNPVDIDRFDPARHSQEAARQLLGITGNPLIGVIAQITPWKGQDRAIRLLTELRRTNPEAGLLLAGETKFVTRATRYDNRGYEERLHELIRRHALTDHVRFLGEREDTEVILEALDVLLVPSTEEPFGRTVIEALALNVPVVATNAGGPREVIRQGVDGVTLDVDDTAAWAAAVRDLAKRGRNADSRSYAIERFDADAHARAVVAIYEEALRAAGTFSRQSKTS